MKKINKYKDKVTEWIVFTFVFFFLYDVIWAISDLDDFKRNFATYSPGLLLDLVYCGFFSLVSLMVNQLLLRQRFFKLAETNRKRFLSCVLVIVTINIFIAVVCDLLLDVFNPDFIEDDVWGTFYLFGIIASMLTLIHLLLHYSDVIISRHKENISLQKKYLKLQLDPHFVFNSLSTLAGMIEDYPKKAEEYVVRLSQVYRYILRNIDKDYINLYDAIDFTQTYIRLLNMRFGGGIILVTDGVKPYVDEYILSLSLQLIIENAVKHNPPLENEPLRIEISVQDNRLVIKNNRIYTNGRNDQNIESNGIGLRNLNQRYALDCGKKIECNVTANSFEVGLPIINKGV